MKNTYETMTRLGGSPPGFHLGTTEPMRPSIIVVRRTGLPKDRKGKQKEPQDATRILFVLPPKGTKRQQIASKDNQAFHNSLYIVHEDDDNKGTKQHGKKRLEEQGEGKVEYILPTGDCEMPGRRIGDVGDET